MARKSRKNMMPQAAVQEAVQQNEKELLRTAAYARLSVENGGHETEDSLHTQILQIHNYIRENPELTLTDTYADNGFTGTRFDRPEFERMMQDVRTGKIQCIVVKDLSRFGRDYIETGSYVRRRKAGKRYDARQQSGFCPFHQDERKLYPVSDSGSRRTAVALI